jgi:hypothetical protein
LTYANQLGYDVPLELMIPAPDRAGRLSDSGSARLAGPCDIFQAQANSGAEDGEAQGEAQNDEEGADTATTVMNGITLTGIHSSVDLSVSAEETFSPVGLCAV